MKKINIFLGFLTLVLLATSCVGEFEELNNHPHNDVLPNVEETVYLLPDLFQYTTRNNHNSYQRSDQLYCNIYAQHTANTSSTFASGQYDFETNWAFALWFTSFYGITNQAYVDVQKRLETYPEKDNNTFQLVRIMRAQAAANVTDNFGDMPYSEAGTGNTSPKFDTQKEIYTDIFKELKEAAEAITPGVSDPLLDEYDLIYRNDFNKWITFANSLRLRFAIRISKVDPEWARTEGEAALADGVMTEFNQSARSLGDPIDRTFGADQRGHAMHAISDWNEFRMSSKMEDLLENTSSIVDPREAIWFQPAQNYPNNDPDIAEGNEYKGIPNGLNSTQLSEPGNTFGDGSNIRRDDGPYFNQWRSFNVMTYAEVCFLKAEAALLGWAGAGDAEENYLNGIRASMEETVFTEPEYDTIVFEIPETVLNEYLSGGDVPFKTAGTNEEKLEQIITQKWLALFPQGSEAWCDFRRTGYPELIPVANNLDSDIPDGEFIKKLRLVQTELDLNNTLTPEGISALNQGQGDNQNVRVWWDVD